MCIFTFKLLLNFYVLALKTIMKINRNSLNLTNVEKFEKLNVRLRDINENIACEKKEMHEDKNDIP